MFIYLSIYLSTMKPNNFKLGILELFNTNTIKFRDKFLKGGSLFDSFVCWMILDSTIVLRFLYL